MWRLVKSVLAGGFALAIAAGAFWLWMLYEVQSLPPGHWDFAWDKRYLVGIAVLVFAAAFSWQWRRAR